MDQRTFQYVAVDRRGARLRGVIEAETRDDAYRRLAATGMTPMKLREKSGGKGRGGPLIGRRVKGDEIANMTHQWSVLMEARLPAVECLRSIAEQEPNEHLAEILWQTAARIEGGATITEALRDHERVFGTVYLETVHAAERSGNMVSVLAELAEMIEQRQEMTRAVRSALTYPVLVVVALVVAIAFLVTFVVPRFAKMFMERGVELPALTRMLMAVGESVQGYWWAYLGVLIAGAIATKAAWGSPSFRLRADRVVARIPYVSRVLRGLALTRFSSVFGLSLGSGLGLIDSLELGGRAAGRPLLMRDARMLIDQVRKGGRLAEVLRDAEYLPPFARQLMSAGEQSAELRRMCDVISRHYARETSHLVKNAATVVEPVLIAGLTMVVLVVALAIFLPMWDMVTLVG